ncbi:MAG: N-formylglutamate amidohydrolase [Robiginitomaculum sp.]|nr:N-formylglutamate amidohydrolase [Robiginitomaculum sp.]
MSNLITSRIIGDATKSPVFFFCDHAVNTIPEKLSSLGLPLGLLAGHIAYDPGAATLSEVLAIKLKARALFCGFSRLVIDPNRGIDRDDLIVETSDGISVPGNQNLAKSDIEHRLNSYFHPYHQTLSDELDALTTLHQDPFIISIHTFSKQLRQSQQERPWEVGLLWSDDQQSADIMMQSLSKAGVIVGDNQPYSAKIYNYSVNRHVGSRGLRHITLEVRQDLLLTDNDVNKWRDLLFEPLQGLIAK